MSTFFSNIDKGDKQDDLFNNLDCDSNTDCDNENYTYSDLLFYLFHPVHQC